MENRKIIISELLSNWSLVALVSINIVFWVVIVVLWFRKCNRL